MGTVYQCLFTGDTGAVRLHLFNKIHASIFHAAHVSWTSKSRIKALSITAMGYLIYRHLYSTHNET
ncbi:hypothetical protein [Desulfobacter hydrogenophilus]|uniref:Uncharacterized protein n=1 Tax=Desulfobacter hydrogenophilus TaxID=2291 RepID=A0ABX5RA92_9BACT|nr:hypothetical protein [Desulfobacter hydrogenophilus]NDY70841.1 hypothetical protein [Desulfobacter hydrogenophilus]QBH11612.1 hypothetical protein EYB58_00940 [Desulfobacter hydrogenophilus]